MRIKSCTCTQVVCQRLQKLFTDTCQRVSMHAAQRKIFLFCHRTCFKAKNIQRLVVSAHNSFRLVLNFEIFEQVCKKTDCDYKTVRNSPKSSPGWVAFFSSENSAHLLFLAKMLKKILEAVEVSSGRLSFLLPLWSGRCFFRCRVASSAVELLLLLEIGRWLGLGAAPYLYRRTPGAVT